MKPSFFAVALLFILSLSLGFLVGEKFGAEREQMTQLHLFTELLSSYEETALCLSSDKEYEQIKNVATVSNRVMPNISKWMPDGEAEKLKKKLAVRLAHLAELVRSPQASNQKESAKSLFNGESQEAVFESAYASEKARELRRGAGKCVAR